MKTIGKLFLVLLILSGWSFATIYMLGTWRNAGYDQGLYDCTSYWDEEVRKHMEKYHVYPLDPSVDPDAT